MSAHLDPSRIADQAAANRISDAVSLALIADFDLAIRSYMTFSLVDGRSDGTLYPSWNVACEHASNKSERHAPLRVTPDGITADDALIWLRTIRRLGFQPVGAPPEHASSSQIWTPGGRKLRRRF